MSQRVFKQTLALAEQASFYIVTLGQCDEYSLLFRHRLLSGIELQDLKRAGAVCDCMGNSLMRKVKLSQSDLNERTLAVDLEHLYDREVMLLCAGRQKLRGWEGRMAVQRESNTPASAASRSWYLHTSSPSWVSSCPALAPFKVGIDCRQNVCIQVEIGEQMNRRGPPSAANRC